MLFGPAHAQILQRRRALQARSQALRLQIAQDARALQGPLALADQVHGAVRWLAAHPQWPVAGVLLLAVLRPRRLIGWGLRLWGAWRLWRQVRSAVELVLDESRKRPGLFSRPGSRPRGP